MEAKTHSIPEALDARLAQVPPGVAALYRELLEACMRDDPDTAGTLTRLSRKARFWEIKATLLELAQAVTTEKAFWPQALATVRLLFGASQVVLWRLEEGRLIARHRTDERAETNVSVALPLLEEAIASGQVQTAPVADPSGEVRLCLLGPVTAGTTLEGVLQVVLTTSAMRPEQAEDLRLACEQLGAALETVRRVERLSFYASHDPLTGLANRRHFEEYIEREFKLARRHHTPMSVLVVDVDHFKAYNDTYGHLAGDRLLQAIAGAMAGCVRSTDFIARTGGEEFVIVLPHTDASGAKSAAEKVLDAIRSLPGRAEVLSGKVTASIGVACCDGGACSATALLESADRAMYRAKQGGRDRICAA